MNSKNRPFSTLKGHKGAILVSLLIGFIFLLPYLLIPSLQDQTQNFSPLVAKGVDARSVDEVLYAAYVQEVAEGHLIPRSNVLEWKDQLILSHAGAPFPSLILGIISILVGGVVNTYILSYFLFTALSSALIYALSYLLTKNKTLSLIAPPLLFFSPTYMLKFFHDQITQPVSYFSRFYPVLVDFPIFAFTLIFVFLLLKENRWKFAVLSGILGGLLFYTYFYYWTFYVVLIGLLWVWYLIKKEFNLFKKITASGFITIIIGSTFFFNSWRTVQNQAEILQRLGTTFTRNPDWNITFFLLGIGLILYFVWKKTSLNDKNEKKNNFTFLTALLLAGIMIMNVQIFIGYTINPRHWLTAAVWPTLILIGIVVVHYAQTLFNKNLRKIIPKLSGLVIIALLSFGLLWQVSYAQNTYSVYTLSESQQELFDWLNQNTAQDEVVLSLSAEMILLLPAYTHNNNFIPNAIVEPVPISEIVSRRLVASKILDVSEQDIIFLESPCAFGELLSFERTKGKNYNYSLFEEAFSHPLTFESYFSKESCTVPEEYKEGVFKAYAALPEDRGALVGKYHVDYLLLNKKESETVEVPEFAEKVYENSEFILYKVIT